MIAELSTEQKRSIWERQKGMCALTGKKFETFDETLEADYLLINPDKSTELENSVLVIKSGELNPVKRAGSDGKVYLRRYLLPYSNLTSFTKEEFLSEIGIDVKEIAEISKSSRNWKDLKNSIKELTQLLNNHPAPFEEKKELAEMLNSALESVISRNKEEVEKIKAEQSESYNKVKVVVEEAIKFATETTNFKDGREKLIAAQNDFRKASLSREHAEELLPKLNNALEELNRRSIEERENYEMECSENYHLLKAKVEATVDKANKATHFKTARQSLIELQGEIKDKKLKRNQREELYQIIRECFESVNQRQQQERQVSDVEFEENYAKIKKIVDEAVSFAENVTDNFKEAKETLIAAQAAIKAVNLRRTQKDELFADIRRVFEIVNERQNADKEVYDKESDENYSKLSAKVEEAFVYLNNTSDFRLLRENIIGIQSEVRILKLKRDQRRELLDKIQNAFNIIDKLKNDYFEKRKQERTVKLNETLSNLQMKVTRLEESLAADKSSLEALNAAEEKNEETNEKIQQIEARIKDKEEKIEETKKRIEEIEKERDTIK